MRVLKSRYMWVINCAFKWLFSPILNLPCFVLSVLTSSGAYLASFMNLRIYWLAVIAPCFKERNSSAFISIIPSGMWYFAEFFLELGPCDCGRILDGIF